MNAGDKVSENRLERTERRTSRRARKPAARHDRSGQRKRADLRATGASRAYSGGTRIDALNPNGVRTSVAVTGIQRNGLRLDPHEKIVALVRVPLVREALEGRVECDEGVLRAHVERVHDVPVHLREQQVSTAAAASRKVAHAPRGHGGQGGRVLGGRGRGRLPGRGRRASPRLRRAWHQ